MLHDEWHREMVYPWRGGRGVTLCLALGGIRAKHNGNGYVLVSFTCRRLERIFTVFRDALNTVFSCIMYYTLYSYSYIILWRPVIFHVSAFVERFMTDTFMWILIWSYHDIMRQNELEMIFPEYPRGHAQKLPADMTQFYRWYHSQILRSRQLQAGCRDSREQIEKA